MQGTSREQPVGGCDEEGRKWIKKKNGRRTRPYTAKKPRKRRKN
jgi:hypothetical protein